MSLLQQINEMSAKEHYEILAALSVKENVKVDSTKHGAPAKLEKWQRAICSVCEGLLRDMPNGCPSTIYNVSYNVCDTCNKNKWCEKEEMLKEKKEKAKADAEAESVNMFELF